MHPLIAELRTHLVNAYYIYSALMVLEWDEHTYMPPRAAQRRGGMKSQLAAIGHNRLTDPVLLELLERLQKDDTFPHLSFPEQALVREAAHDAERARKIPGKYVEELQEVTTHAFEAWQAARKAADFSIFAPSLEKIVELKRQEAEYVGYTTTAYDALLDEYEPGMREATIRAEFEPLQQSLTQLVKKIAASDFQPQAAIMEGSFSVQSQQKIAAMISRALGYDLQAGRLDVSPHPFEMPIAPDDVRITTRYRPDNFFESLSATMHETGHALYDQGMPAEEYGTPLAQAVSLGMHESQSKLWENHVGRSRSFWQFAYPLLQKEYKRQFQGVSLEDFYWASNSVKPSLIRTESDEVTYNLHIVLRFELETQLMSGAIKVKDLPELWNAKMQEYLGITVPNDAQGVLQDMHWANGVIGYFPTYALGTMYAAQFYQAAEKAIPNLATAISLGNFKPLRNWLKENIHQYGRQYSSRELLERITGEPMHSRYFSEYLNQKYGEIYQLKD